MFLEIPYSFRHVRNPLTYFFAIGVLIPLLFCGYKELDYIYVMMENENRGSCWSSTGGLLRLVVHRASLSCWSDTSQRSCVPLRVPPSVRIKSFSSFSWIIISEKFLQTGITVDVLQWLNSSATPLAASSSTLLLLNITELSVRFSSCCYGEVLNDRKISNEGTLIISVLVFL